MDHARFRLSIDAPSARHVDHPVGLEIDRAARSNASPDASQDTLEKLRAKRGIEKYHVESVRGIAGRGRAGMYGATFDRRARRLARDEFYRSATVNFATCGVKVRCRRSEMRTHGTRLIDEDNLGGVARQRLESERTGTGEQIQAPLTGEVLPQPVEQGFADPIGRRADRQVLGETDQTTAPGAADDANRVCAALSQGGGLLESASIIGTVIVAGSPIPGLLTARFLILGSARLRRDPRQANRAPYNSRRLSRMFGWSKKKDDAQVPKPEVPEAARRTWFDKLKQGLRNTSAQLGSIFTGRKIDEALFEELETALLVADTGVEATQALLQALRARVRKERLESADQLKEALREEITTLLTPLEAPLDSRSAKPFVVMIAGVNGVGKTTSIGKLAKYFQLNGQTVLLAAGDTFRAAAREQLAAWGERNGVSVIAQQGSDPGAVVFDAIAAARARGTDVVIADTAGRLPTQLHLMEELKKVHRVIGKAQEGAPHEVLLVLDANTGQNTLNQVRAFDEAVGLTGLLMTKLDGTAKGGVVVAIAHSRARNPQAGPLPLRFIGVGEGLDDLRPFVAAEFARALLD